jgi:magnesium transporter
MRLDSAQIVCITNDAGVLLGVVSIERLLEMPAGEKMGEAMRAPPVVHPEEDQEKVASLALHHDLNAVPVVDHENKLLGVVPPSTIIAILRHEHAEDLHRFAGIRHDTAIARQAMNAPPIRRVRDRLPWLLAGLAGSMLATLVMVRFEQALQAQVAIAFFVPGLVYLADAIGTQTETITVRGLSLSHAPIGYLLGRELRTGVLIGLFLGALILPLVWIAFGDPRLAAAVALSVVFAGAVATSIGLMLPWLLMKLKRDPAFGSGPLATIIQDVLSLLIYFLVVSLALA